ncbi:MAG: glycosyltransferase family 39 protein [Lentisphaeria bacterium]|nr:glycosyltransferase family 39 protein [Lentisphaeria bacterium]
MKLNCTQMRQFFSSMATALRRGLRGRRFCWALALILLLGFLLRLAVCLQLYHSAAVQSPLPVTDMATYRRLALEIRQGNWPAFFDYQPFYYSIFLPLLYVLSPGGAPWPVIAAQLLVGSAALWLVGLGAAQLYGRRAGCLAALLLAVSQFHILYTPYLLLEVLQSFWMALIFYYVLKAYKKNRAADWLLLALFCSLSTLTRGNALLFVPGILALLVYRNWPLPKRAAALSLLFILLFYLPQLPFSWRNYRHFGRWRGPSTAQDKVLALGNSPEAPPGGLEYPRSYQLWCSQSDEPDPAKRVSVSRQMLRRLRHEPLLFLELKFRTLLLFWDRGEIPNNISLHAALRHSPLLRFFLPFALLGSLGLAGLFYSLYPFKGARLCLAYAILAYCLGTVAFYMLARFRIGALPLLCIAGGGALRLLLPGIVPDADGQLRRLRRQKRLLLLLLAVFVVNSAYANYQRYLEPAFMRRFLPYGIALDHPQELVFYDHGPLSFGGSLLWPLEKQQSLLLEKEFVVPPELRERVEGRAALVWLRVFCATNAVFKAELEYEGQGQPYFDLHADRMNQWLRFELPELNLQDGVVTLRFKLQAIQGEFAVVLDQYRKYQRSRLQNQDGTLESLDMELCAELQIPK